MVRVGVCQEDVADRLLWAPGLADVPKQGVDIRPDSGVHDCGFTLAHDEVAVAVVRIGQVEAAAAAGNQVDLWRELHADRFATGLPGVRPTNQERGGAVSPAIARVAAGHDQCDLAGRATAARGAAGGSHRRLQPPLPYVPRPLRA